MFAGVGGPSAVHSVRDSGLFLGVGNNQWCYDSKLYSNLKHSSVSETWFLVRLDDGYPGLESITPEGPGLGPSALARPLESDDGAVPGHVD